MKTKPTKLPKAVVAGLHFSAKGHPLFLSQCAIQGGDTYPWCLVLPCSSRKEANQRKKWANMSGGQKVEGIAAILYRDANPMEYSWARHGKGSAEGDACETLAKRILALMGEPTP